MNKPKILFFDIETTPNLVFSWGIGKQYLTHDQIFKERKISCIGYKWAGSNTVTCLKMNLKAHSLLQYDDKGDEDILKEFLEVYSKADLAVGHNALRFDIAHIKARLLRHGLPDITPVILDDTYLATATINFNCSKLDYLSKYLTTDRKQRVGFSLWVDVMMGSATALDKMAAYCKKDVIVLEQLYNKLKPFIKSKLNQSVLLNNPEVCPSCGEAKLSKNGFRRTNAGLYQRFMCYGCGKHCTNGVGMLVKSKQFKRLVD